MTLVFESLEYGKELLIMSVIIQLGQGQGSGVKCDQANFTVRAGNGENACDGIIRHVGLNHYGGTRLKVGEDWSGGEGFLQLVKGLLACIGEVPGGVFPSQPSQGDHDVRVVKYELTIEIREAEEGLNVLYFLRLRPITNSLDFVFQHCQAIGRKEVSKIPHGVQVEFTFFGFGERFVLLKASEHLLNVFSMVFHIVQVD